MTRILRIIAAILSLATLSCSRAADQPWRPPDVILISLDTLRADHLPTYGYDRPTAPNLDALARESLVFERAYAEAPHTLPSHTSLFTGLYPGRHGVLDRGDTLAPEVPTLAEVLAADGYQTAGFTSCYFLTPEFRLDRGFAHYEFAHDIESPRNADVTNEAILRWIDTLGDGPFFLFAHYFDIHSDWDQLPYDAPEEFRRRLAGDPPPGFRSGNGSVAATRWLALQNRMGSDLGAEELRYIEHLYDAGIAWTDSQIGALLAALAERGRLDRAIVIVTADHGEEFQEHGKLLHTQVYDEHLRIPLLISLPEMRGGSGPACRPRPSLPELLGAGRTRALAQHVDLLATLTDCLGIDLPPGVQGSSLLPALAGATPSRDAAFFDTPRGTQYGILRDGWKLIETAASGRQRLFQLDGDPAEQRDVSAREPERTRALASELAAHRHENEAGRVEGENVAVPEEVHRALESLGYVREEPTP